jgi:N-acetylglucosaminyldiphosphoundecaprenol N-acetyl-beta-D-mannosaminyltransferase
MARSVDAALLGLECIELLGVRIHQLSVDALIDLIIQAVQSRRKILAVYANVHTLNLAYDLEWFRDFYNRADVVFCDGFGVKWAAQLFGVILPRYTPPDWIPKLSQACVQYNLSIFFVGGQPGVAEKAAAHLKQQAEDLRIVGTHHGYFDKTAGTAENESVIQIINAAKPDIVILGFGMPIQERWLLENWDRLDTSVALTAGAMFDFLAGEVWRGPRWMTDHGLEWLSRFLTEPRRLWRRYLIGNPLFVARILKQRLRLS